MNPFDDFAAIIGIDWADRKHDLCLKTFDSETLEFSVLEHKPEAIEDWANDLRMRFDGRPVAICIESRKVPLIYALLKYDFLVLFPVNPQNNRGHPLLLDSKKRRSFLAMLFAAGDVGRYRFL